jgi:hypothetical protein
MNQSPSGVPQYDGNQSNNKGLASISHILGNAMSWQIFLVFYTILSFLLITAFIGIFMLLLLPLVNMVFCLVAAVKASNGYVWNYPGTIDIFNSNNPQHSQKPNPQRNQNEMVGNQQTKPTNETKDPYTGRKINQSMRKEEKTPDTEEDLKEMYLNGEISEEEFDEKLKEIQQNEELNRDYN